MDAGLSRSRGKGAKPRRKAASTSLVRV
jgi:hypothetical protein